MCPFFHRCASFCRNVEHVEYAQKPLSKNASFWGNVEYVEYVEWFWNLQTLFKRRNYLKGIQHSTLKFKEAFSKNVPLPAELLNMLDTFESLSPQICFFVGKCGICWFGWLLCWASLELTGLIQKEVCKVPKHSTHSTLPEKEAHGWEHSKNTFNIFNILKMHLTTVILNVYFFWGEPGRVCKFKKTFSIINIAAERNTFLGNIPYPKHIQHIQHLSWKKHIFEKICFSQL